MTFGLVLFSVFLWAPDAFAAPGSGSAEIIPSTVSAGLAGTWTISYVASEAFNTGVVEVLIPDDWTAPQIADSSLAGFVDADLPIGTFGSPKITIFGRMIQVRIQTMAVADTVYIIYGDVSRDPGGAAEAQTSVAEDVAFQVASNPQGLSATSPLTSGSPSVDVVPAAISRIVFTTSPRTFTAGGESGVMRIRTEDEFGNPDIVASDQDIYLTSTSGSGLFSHLGGAGFAGTDTVTILAGTDTVSFYYRDELAGTHTITASAVEQGWTDATQLVTVDEASPYKLAVEPQDTTAVAGDFVRFTITVQDQYGNDSPVTSAQTITLSPGPGDFYDKDDHGTQVSQVVIASGNYTAEADYMHTGMDTESGYLLLFGDGDGVPPALELALTTIYIDHASADSSANEVAGDKSEVTADGTDELGVTVTVRDAYGNPVSGALVVLEATGGGNDITDPVGTTGPDGIAAGSVRSTVAEQKVVRALINGIQAVDTLIVDFVPGSVSYAESGIAGDKSVITADGIDELEVTVTVRDAQGNLVSGSLVVLESTGSGNDFTQPGSVTGSDGIAVGYLRSMVAESKTVSARIDGSLADSTLTVDFVPGAVSLTESEVTGDKPTVTADGADELEVTVTVRDAQGNPVSGSTVVLEASGSGNGFTQPVGVTGSDGIAVGYVRSTVAEQKVVRALIDGSQAVDTLIVDFVAGEVSLTESSVVGNKETVYANGTDELEVTVTVRDAQGNPVSGSTVVLEASGSGNGFTQPGSVTGSDGIAVGYLRSTVAEQKTVSARIDGSLADSTLTVDFVPGAVSYAESGIAGDKDPVTADGADELAVTVTVRDAEGNPVSGSTVELVVSGTGNDVTDPVGTTGGDGIAVGYVRSTVAEGKTVSARIDGSLADSTLTVDFVPGPVSLTESSVEGDKNTVYANDTDELEVTVTVRDAYRNPVSGSTIELVASGSGNSYTQPADTTDSNGIAVGYVRSTVAEEKIVRALIDEAYASDRDTVLFIADVASPSESEVAGDKSEVPANGMDSITVTVTVRDGSGNPVSGANVELFATGDGNSYTQPGTSGLDGIAVGAVRSTVAEEKVIRALINSVQAVDTLIVDFTAGSVSYAESGIAGDKATVTADGVDEVEVTVTVRDANGNPVSGSLVVLESTGSGNDFTQPGSVTGSDGIAIGYLRSTVAEGKTVSARIDGSLADSTLTVDFVTGAVSYSESGMAGDKSTVTADGADELEVTVTVRDAQGNPVSGSTVELVVSGSGNDITDPVGTTGGDGVAIGYVRSTIAEQKTVSARIDGSLADSTLSVDFEAGPVSYSESGIGGDKDPVTADGADELEVTVTVRDAQGNPVSGSLVALESTGSGNSFTQPGSVTGSDGIAVGYLRSTVAEEKTVSALIGGSLADSTLTVDFVPGDVDYFIITQDGDATAGVTDYATIEVRDDNDNRIEAFSGTVSIYTNTTETEDRISWSLGTAAGTIISESRDTVLYQFSPADNGIAQLGITDTKAESIIIYANIGAVTSSSATPLLVDHASADSIFMVSGDGQSAVVYTEVPAQLVVGVEDAYGNRVGDEPVTFTAVRGGGTVDTDISAPGEQAVDSTGSDGLAVCESWLLGTVSGTDSDEVEAAISGGGTTVVSFIATALPDEVVSIELTPPSRSVTVNSTNTQVWATLRDQFDNPVPGEYVTIFFADTPDGSLSEDGSNPNPTNPVGSGRAGTTDSDGTISVIYNAPATAGLQDVLDADHALVPASEVDNVTYTAVVDEATELRVTLQGSGTAKARESFEFVVEAVDNNGNLDDGNTSHIIITPPAGGFTFSLSDFGAEVTEADLSAGQVTLYGRGTTTGTWDIGVEDAAAVLSAASFQVEITASDTVDYYIATAPPSIVAGQEFAVHAEAYDRYDNLVTTANYGVDLRAVQSADSTLAASDVLNKTTGTVVNGVYDESSMRYTTAESIRIEITDSSSPVIGYSGAIEVLNAAAYRLEELSGDSTGVAAGDSVLLRARVYDRHDNRVPGQTVYFSVQEGGGGLAADERVTDSSGEVSVMFGTGPVAGDNLVRAAILDGDPASLEYQYFEIGTVPRTAIDHVLLYLEGTSFMAGESFGIDIEAYDEYDNLLSNDFSSRLVPVDERSTMAFIPDTVTLNGGTASFTASDTLTGQNRVAILSEGGDTLSVWSPYISIDNANAYEITALSGDTTGVIAGDATELKAVVTDPYGNRVDGEIVRFSITSDLGGDPSLWDPVGNPADGIVTTDTDGIALCSLTTDINQGDNIVTASIDDANPPELELVTYTVWTSAGNIRYYDLGLSEQTIKAGEVLNMAVVGYDENDNIVLGDDTTEVDLSSDGSAFFSANPVTLTDGSALVNVRDTVAERLVLYAETADGGAFSRSDTITVTPEVPYGTIGIASVVPDTITATGKSKAVITTEAVRDRYGNIVTPGTLVTVITTLGEVLSDDADPATPGTVERMTGVNGVVSVFIGSPETPGTDIITFQSVEGSATGQAQLVYAPQPDCRYGGYLSPGFVVPGGTVQFICSVENISETALSIDQTSTISFSDSVGNTYSTTLPAPVFIGGSSTVTLVFNSSDVPGGMLGGTYTPKLDLEGTDIYDSPYDTRFDADVNSVTVSSIEIISITPYETLVSRGDTVSVEVKVWNSSGNEVNIGDIDFTFTNSTSVRVGEWDPPLPHSLAPSSERPYTAQIYILPSSPTGADTIDASVTAAADGTEIRDSSADDAVGVWTVQSAAKITYVGGSLDPMTVSQGQDHAFGLRLDNAGEASVILNQPATTLSFTDGSSSYSASLSSAQALPGKAISTISFAEQAVPPGMTPGSYAVTVELVGTENGAPFDTTIVLTDQVQVQAPAQIAYEPGTLDPLTVSKRSSVAFEIGVENTGGATVECVPDSTWLTFTDGVEIYLARLDGNRGSTVPPGLGTLYFRSVTVPEGLPTGRYGASVRIQGTENGLPFETVLQPSDSIDVQEPSQLAINSITVLPTGKITADQEPPWYAVINVQNYGGADVRLDSLKIRLFNGPTEVTGQVDIDWSGFGWGSFVLSGTESADIPVLFVDNADNAMTIGTVVVEANLWGMDLPSSTVLEATTESGGKGSYLVQSPADLVVMNVIASVPTATALQTKDWTVRALLRNDGQSDIELDLDPDSTYALFSTSSDFDVIYPTELQGGELVLEGGSTDTLLFTVDRTGSMSGLCSIDAAVRGVEINSGRILPPALPAAPAEVLIQSEAALEIMSLTALQDPVTILQERDWSIEMRVRNTGESDVTVLLDSTWVQLPDGTGFDIGNPLELVGGGLTLAGSAEGLLRFDVPTTGDIATGQQVITGRIYAIEQNSDRPVWTIEDASTSTDSVTFYERLDPAYAAGTLDPTVVSSGTEVAVELGILSADPWYSTLLLDPATTTLVFGDADGDTFRTHLSQFSSDMSVEGGATTTLLFEGATVDTAIAVNASYPVAVRLRGTENGNPFSALLSTVPDEITVQDAPQLSIIDIEVPPSVTISQTEPWEARMVLQNNGEAAVELDLTESATYISFVIPGIGDVTGEYTVAWPSGLEETGSDTLYGGEEGTLVFTITETGATAGALLVHGHVAGTDINSEVDLADDTFDGGWGNMVVQLPGDPVIQSTLPSRSTVTSDQTTPWYVTVTVCNEGEADLTLIPDSTRIETDPAYAFSYTPPSEFEGGGTLLQGGECRELLFIVTSTPVIPAGADVDIHARAGFEENNSGIYREFDTQTALSGYGSIRVQAPADLSIARVENAAPRASYVNIGQRFPIAFEIVNNGEAAAGQIYISLTSNGGSIIEDSPVVLPEIEGSNGTVVDTFHIIASDITGAEIFTAAIDSALDINSGQNDLVGISPSTDDTTLAEIQTPGALIMTRLVPSQGEVNQDQIAEWTLTAHVENTGEAPVLLDPPPSESDIVFSIGVVQQTDYDVDAPTGFASGGVGFVLDGYAADSLVYIVKDTGSDTGTVDIRASIDWKDRNIPEVSQTAAFADTNVHVGRPEGLRIISVTTDAPNNELYPNTSIVNTGQVFNLIVHVENSGSDHIDSLVVEVDSNNGTDAIYTGDPYPSILSGDELDFDFVVTASDSEEVEILTASIVYAVSRNDPENPPDPLQADDNTENIRVQLPALLSCSASITAPEGAMDDTVSVGMAFVLTAVVENSGEASIDDSGELTLTLPTEMSLDDPVLEPTVRSFTAGDSIGWTIVAPSTPSTDTISVMISSIPLDMNYGDIPASVDAVESRLGVVTVDEAGIEVTRFEIEAPEGAYEDYILSTDQAFTVGASVIPSVDADSVRLELVVPAGFEIAGDAEVYIGEGDGTTERTAQWAVTAPSGARSSETMTLRASGWDENREESFTEPDVTFDLQIVTKAVLALSALISGPPDATDGVISIGLAFTVEATVENTGEADVDTAGAKLEIVLPEGYSFNGDTGSKPFYPGVPVTWNLRAPNEPAPPGNIIVRLVEPYAKDENSGQAAFIAEGEDLIPVQTEEGYIALANISSVTDLDTIPPYVVPQGALGVPVLRIEMNNNSSYEIGLDTLFVTVERSDRRVADDPSRFVSRIELLTPDGGTFDATVGTVNPVPIAVDLAYTIGSSVVDTLLMRADIAAGAPAGELRFDIAGSNDVVMKIDESTPVGVEWEGDGGDIAGHFLSGPLSVMSGNFEEYVHNYPNPFKAGSENTRIAYFMTEDAPVTIRIYDLMGNLVWTKDIAAGEVGATGSEPGTWCEVNWDGRNDKGQLVRNGVYLCRIQAGSRSATFKIAVAK